MAPRADSPARRPLVPHGRAARSPSLSGVPRGTPPPKSDTDPSLSSPTPDTVTQRCRARPAILISASRLSVALTPTCGGLDLQAAPPLRRSALPLPPAIGSHAHHQVGVCPPSPITLHRPRHSRRPLHRAPPSGGARERQSPRRLRSRSPSPSIVSTRGADGRTPPRGGAGDLTNDGDLERDLLREGAGERDGDAPPRIRSAVGVT